MLFSTVEPSLVLISGNSVTAGGVGQPSKATHLLFAEFFPEPSVKIRTHGNVLAAVALLEGLTSGELMNSELDHVDPDYEIMITVRVQKPVEPNKPYAQ